MAQYLHTTGSIFQSASLELKSALGIILLAHAISFEALCFEASLLSR